MKTISAHINNGMASMPLSTKATKSPLGGWGFLVILWQKHQLTLSLKPSKIMLIQYVSIYHLLAYQSCI